MSDNLWIIAVDVKNAQNVVINKQIEVLYAPYDTVECSEHTFSYMVSLQRISCEPHSMKYCIYTTIGTALKIFFVPREVEKSWKEW